MGFLLFGIAVLSGDWYWALPPDARATYVGSGQCANCHTEEHHQWTGSHHDRAMEIADERSVLGDFDDAEFTYQGVTTRMFRKGEEYFIHTEGPDGVFQDFKVQYTFGVDPLQQYMVEFPDGRVQVLRVSWDTIRQRWFYVTPPDVVDERILPGDPLHWTGTAQNWNHTCAECHSTNLHKNYNLATDTYKTTFSEIDVACEACHGPGSLHVDIAESISIFWDRNHGYAIESLNEKKSTKQVESCAACHARRSAIHPSFRPGEKFLDDFDPALLFDQLYEADGQILDEVYVYGSFLQSKMHGENVRCTDCHDAHSLALKLEGNRLCGQCHTPGKYDSPTHHHHEPGMSGSLCVQCHMRSKVYMVIDPRRDHSFRVPRPDLTVSVGTPNACGDCHEEPATWAADKVREWYGEKRADDPHYAAALVAGRRHDAGADELLAGVVRRPRADIARATAITLLAQYDTKKSRTVRLKALGDSSPLVRTAAVRAFPISEPQETVRRLAPRLADSVRLVRIAAARQLAGFPQRFFARHQRDALATALDEYRAGQSLALDRAASHMNLGQIAEAQGQAGKAAQSFRNAIRLEPYLTGPRSQLAALLERELEQSTPGRLAGVDKAAFAKSEKMRKEVDRLRAEELENLARDVQLLPEEASLRYRYGLALYLSGRYTESEEALREATELDPRSYDAMLALTLLYEKMEKWDAAIATLEQCHALRPEAPDIPAIFDSIQTMRAVHAKKPKK